ncbi:hypothetical protein N0V88_006692 [Collariella sp. IMI 366227]|nr:hypothetical protein N0V88_006692 [Collariella sp. IMI 366227]
MERVHRRRNSQPTDTSRSPNRARTSQTEDYAPDSPSSTRASARKTYSSRQTANGPPSSGNGSSSPSSPPPRSTPCSAALQHNTLAPITRDDARPPLSGAAVFRCFANLPFELQSKIWTCWVPPQDLVLVDWSERECEIPEDDEMFLPSFLPEPLGLGFLRARREIAVMCFCTWAGESPSGTFEMLFAGMATKALRGLVRYDDDREELERLERLWQRTPR